MRFLKHRSVSASSLCACRVIDASLFSPREPQPSGSPNLFVYHGGGKVGCRTAVSKSPVISPRIVSPAWEMGNVGKGNVVRDSISRLAQHE
ncbi:hypothetical protein ACRALDRAFT_1093753 [Sodiomyces alcalophilus JCM 7366]|uniref:uncharacterized protein n=1 Tax=Sodiomyces alcalophilus JCM 7366 TaxID=591952 RepID=UPI0039B5A726